MRARIGSPSSRARTSLATTVAEAPSLKPGALPAVTVPPCLRKAGLSAASASSVVSGADRLVVLDQRVAPFLPGISTGTISSRKRPASVAACAFMWL